MNNPDHISIKKAVEIYMISKSRQYRYRRDNTIRFYKIGRTIRYVRQDIEFDLINAGKL